MGAEPTTAMVTPMHEKARSAAAVDTELNDDTALRRIPPGETLSYAALAARAARAAPISALMLIFTSCLRRVRHVHVPGWKAGRR